VTFVARARLRTLLVAALIACVPIQALAGLVMPIGIAVDAMAGRGVLPPCHDASAAAPTGVDDRSGPAADDSTRPSVCERCTLCHLATASMPAAPAPLAALAPRAIQIAGVQATPTFHRPPPDDPPPRRPAKNL
jgi:hypothetical protein